MNTCGRSGGPGASQMTRAPSVPMAAGPVPAIAGSGQGLVAASCLRGMRHARSLSTSDAAAALEVHPNTVLRWERGERLPGPAHVIALAELYGTPVSDVVQFFDKHRQQSSCIEKGASAFGRNLRPLRVHREITVRNLAEGLGVAPHRIYNWESGSVRIPARQISGLAQALGMDEDRVRWVLRQSVSSSTVPTSRDNVVRARRAELGLSQVAFAHRAGVELSTLKSLENGGNCSLRCLRLVALALGVPTARLASILGGTLPTELDLRSWRTGDFPDVLRTLRMWSCLTQHQLAAHVAVSSSTIRSWESGRTQPLALSRARLESVFRLPTDSLLACLSSDAPIGASTRMEERSSLRPKPCALEP